MKQKILIAAMLMTVAGVQTTWAQNVVLKFHDIEQIKYKVSELESITFEENGVGPDIVDGHECVDLGLPSRTLWATCNIGANTPEGYGDYFAWAETEPKEEYSWETYKYCRGTQATLTKYNSQSNSGYNGFVDDKTNLDPEDDAATVAWGSKWQMPSYGQIGELADTCYTTAVKTEQNGVTGMLVTSKINGNSIFLPAAGYKTNSRVSGAGSRGYYWSNTLGRGWHACELSYTTSLRIQSSGMRCNGYSVRPVHVQAHPYGYPVTNIELTQTELVLAKGTSEHINGNAFPKYARNTDITWESSDPSVAKISFYQTSCNVTALAEGTCTIICRATDGSGVTAECQVTVATQGTTDGHGWVDLGLPSGTIWATSNVGAETPEAYGHYVSWGESEPKESYDFVDYVLFDESVPCITKYCTTDQYYSPSDGRTWLQPEDDAASVIWGKKWQMPSSEQFEELINSEYTTSERVNQNGASGLLVTSLINGNSIFLPTGGMYMGQTLFSENYSGDYWSRSLYTSASHLAYYLTFAWSGPRLDYHYRPYGMNVRPVRFQDIPYVNEIRLNKTTLCLEPNGTEQLSVNVFPSNAVNSNVTWLSSKPSIARVDETGKVTAGTSTGFCTITCRATDGSGTFAECEVLVVGDLCPDGNHPHAVSLGLPSGTKWCCQNVGTTSPTEYGGYYAWGETEEKDNYNTSNYKVPDDTDIAGTQNDVARVKMGAPWRMPSLEQMKELMNNCSQAWVKRGGKNGIIVVGPNGNYIFLPAGGNYWLSWNDGSGYYGEYWTSSYSYQNISTPYSYYLRFAEEETMHTSNFRSCEGKLVRPVQ